MEWPSPGHGYDVGSGHVVGDAVSTYSCQSCSAVRTAEVSMVDHVKIFHAPDEYYTPAEKASGGSVGPVEQSTMSEEVGFLFNALGGHEGVTWEQKVWKCVCGEKLLTQDAAYSNVKASWRLHVATVIDLLAGPVVE